MNNCGTDSIPMYYLEGKKVGKSILITADSLLALFTLQCCQISQIAIVFVQKSYVFGGESGLKEHVNRDHAYFSITIDSSIYKHEFKCQIDCPSIIQKCSFPVVLEEHENYCVVGLCSSLRHILLRQCSESCDDISNQLLGFRKGCLQACSEVSVWTKFCELDTVATLEELYGGGGKKTAETTNIDDTLIRFPESVLKFERHLEHPPVLHNALKHKQEHMMKTVNDKALYYELKNKKLSELPNLEHQYAEGIDLSLADILLYAAFTLVLYKFSNNNLQNMCPLVLKWHTLIDKTPCIINGRDLLRGITRDNLPLSVNKISAISYPDVPNESLYKSDHLRYNPRCRSFTHQHDIEAVLNKVSGITVSFVKLECRNNCFTYSSDCLQEENDMSKLSLANNTNGKYLQLSLINFESKLDWTSLPPPVHPVEGQLPPSRVQRKCEQLESVAQIVLAIAQDGNCIVDFCSGGGHLGILLAYFLPTCTILLVENKKVSLNKAHDRVKALNLKNVEFFQCNLDYFNGTFDIGVCLHACGVATDLVMQKCLIQGAAFVCSPCCYGAVKPVHTLKYPRSFVFMQKYNISPAEYLILGHAADQTHSDTSPKTLQGKKCMKLVDYDRLLYAKSYGYKVILSVMNPPECSPKNHILVGFSSKFEPLCKTSGL